MSLKSFLTDKTTIHGSDFKARTPSFSFCLSFLADSGSLEPLNPFVFTDLCVCLPLQFEIEKVV